MAQGMNYTYPVILRERKWSPGIMYFPFLKVELLGIPESSKSQERYNTAITKASLHKNHERWKVGELGVYDKRLQTPAEKVFGLLKYA